MINMFNRLIRDKRGVTLTAFAIMVPLIILAAGVAVDTARGYLVKKRLGQALDAAALATAGSSGNDAALHARMEAFFYRNFENNRFARVTELDMSMPDSEIVLDAKARVDTVFMRVFNIDYIDVAASSRVQKELRGIEVVLVMDNTGSMSSHNNIGTLRTAARNFVDIMFERAPEPGVIKIGLVPYSTSVNVGPYGLGRNPDGSLYNNGVGFVNNPRNIPYTSNPNSQGWLGCVLEREPEDIEDHSGPWDMYRWCRNNNDNGACQNYNENNRNPNNVCPRAHITPLNSDQALLRTRIQAMQANGNTLGNVGMVWGWRVISPEPPFEEAAAWTNDRWRKAVIMMTDGNNLMHPTYSAYGQTRHHSVRDYQLNEKFKDICEAMKQQDILIYTVTFTSSISNSVKNYYRQCATDTTKYYDAPSQADLIEAFEAISRELSNMYIKS